MAELGDDWKFCKSRNTKLDIKVDTSMLDYEYIANLQCSRRQDREILHAIIHALEHRSQEFGSFPHLLHTAKQKLYSMMNAKERRMVDALHNEPTMYEIHNEQSMLKEWVDSMSNIADTNEIFTSNPDINGREKRLALPIRGHASVLPQNPTKKVVSKTSTISKDFKSSLIRKETMSNHDYFRAWDKFDTEKASLLLDFENEPTLQDRPSKTERITTRLAQEMSDMQKLLEIDLLTDSERLYLAEIDRRKGNEYYRCNDNEQAVSFYSKSLAYNGTNAVTFANRAMANIRLKHYQQAFADCNKALDLDPSYSKAFARRAMIHYAHGRYHDAMSDYRKCLDLDPDNKEYYHLYQKSQQKWSKCIGHGTSKSDDKWTIKKSGTSNVENDLVKDDNGNESLHSQAETIDIFHKEEKSESYISKHSCSNIPIVEVVDDCDAKCSNLSSEPPSIISIPIFESDDLGS